MTALTRVKSASLSSTCTRSRVQEVLVNVLGDAIALQCRGLISKERLDRWDRDLTDVLLLEAVEKFQIKVTLPDGQERGIDYAVFDDGRISTSDSCGGFSVAGLPADASVSLLVRWREGAPKREEARRLLNARGWGTGSMLEAAGPSDRAYSKEGYGVNRRLIGDWEQ